MAGTPPLLYHDLVAWYRLVDPPPDNLDEAACYQAALEGAASPRPETLLELGAGGGHNASRPSAHSAQSHPDLAVEPAMT